MNIAVDFGNTIAKVGIFEDDILVKQVFFPEPSALKDYLKITASKNIIVSSVSLPSSDVLSWSIAAEKKVALSIDLSLPVKILYQTPKTLGVDRIAAVCGALEVHPRQNCLVIDAGTCITYEFLDVNGAYHGGAISPGINMRFEAMNKFTARLPSVQGIKEIDLIGTSTETCMQSGVVNGVRAEVDGIIQQYKTIYPKLKVLLCGGDAYYFEKYLGVQIVPELVLIGLNRILKENVF